MLIKKVQGGFTVIELLIGIGLFGLITPSISFAIVSINRINDRAADLTYASVIAENKIEYLRSAGFNSLTNSVTDFTNELPATFTAPRTATYTVTTPETGMRKIEILISYTDHGTTKNLNYGSIISELGVAQ